MIQCRPPVDARKETCYTAGMFMRCPLIFGTLLVCFAGGKAVQAQGEGDKYIQASLTMLQAVRTIESDLRVETFVDGKEYSARGHYAEQALSRAAPNSFLRSVFRLEINFPMSSAAHDAEPNRMTLVCHASEDGETHRVERYTFVEGAKSFYVIDLKRLEERLKETHREIFFSQVSEVRNLGGLAGMMRQIHRFYEFSPAAQETLQGDEAVPALKLIGTLRTMHHKELLIRFGGLNKKGQYPPGFPSDIEVWLGRHNDFPYRIRYLRRDSEKSEQRELVLQETFFNVELNGAPIPESRFSRLTPPEDIFEQDDTDNFFRALGL